MKKEYDFSNAKRVEEVPALTRHQARNRSKTRITIMLDDEVLDAFRRLAAERGTGYQTLINQALREHLALRPVDEETLRRVLREELSTT